jgi:2,5-dioxopentanoate dehydrogenase
MNNITGQNFIAGLRSSTGTATFTATNATTGDVLPGAFTEATATEIDTACAMATEAFDGYRKTSAVKRAAFLRKIADNLLALGDTLVQRTVAETGLPEGRIVGERGRTMGQLRLFADLIEQGTYVDARIDNAQPERTPLPKGDLRYMKIALGPVAVFGASNFPLAFSTAGGDTASALAAGCPVVVKAHPAHPGCAELVAAAISNAVKACELPAGTFSMVNGTGAVSGQQLVMNPHIKAVGFTGSINAGRAIFNAAASRPEPIPVYAEMGSSNPVFILPKALANRATAIAEGLAAAVCMGAGQFCTNPGLTVVIDSEDAADFIDSTAKLLGDSPAGTTVHASIKDAYDREVAAKLAIEGVEELQRSKATTANDATAVQPLLFKTTSGNYRQNSELSAEVFGPCTFGISCSDKDDLIAFANELEGHLTSTIFGDDEDFVDFAELIAILEKKTGRVIINQYPTGVEVCPSMQHGGPYPASSDTRTTSVGTAAIDRFVRPVAYQNFPQSLLPLELQDENPLQIWRTVDGELTK